MGTTNNIASKDLHSWRCKELSMLRVGCRLNPSVHLRTHESAAARTSESKGVYYVVQDSIPGGSPTYSEGKSSLKGISKVISLRKNMAFSESLIKRSQQALKS